MPTEPEAVTIDL